ncbi:MAG: class I SAM-dependent methyltransferase [Oscillatoriales cyanobacterium]|nr:MAG: class I SAM-dependent methyltransferase [Oscillatoriales cyanobacterium]
MSQPAAIAPDLAQRLAEHLAAEGGQISFADYMSLVLYDPQGGYYASRDRQIGPQGDFITSPHLGPDFAELLAEQVAECWDRLGCPDPFQIVEMGAGQGQMAADLLRHLKGAYPDCWRVTQYQIVEISPALAALQQARLAAAAAATDRVVWTHWDSISPGSIVGCCLSNELVDALPVHRVIWQAGQLQEIYVTSEAGQLVDRVGPLSSDRLASYFDEIGIDWAAGHYPEGYSTEVNLAALDWLATVADRLGRGYLITIDYGYEADRFYHPSRSGGTLQCYTNHAHHNDPYWQPGQQDLTAHVDFTALERWGDRLGLTTLGFTRQSLFLMALGLGDRLMALSGGAGLARPDDVHHIFQRRDTLHRLIDPSGLGNFGVLIQAKGLTDAERETPLTGLSTPAGW